MSKIRKGDKVIVKETKQAGIVISREVKNFKEDGKNPVVEYVVKLGNGFDNYKAFTRKDIKKVPSEENVRDTSTYPRVYNYEHTCADGRTIVTTGVVDKYHSFSFNGNIKTKFLTVGYAICHPSDVNDKQIGAEIAFKRAYEKPITYLETPFCGEFREDFVTVILQSKAKFIEDNIDRFIDRDKK